MAITVSDHLWLAAHDTVTGSPCIGEWPLGVGLGIGLLAELVADGSLELREGELFRTTARPSADIALATLLAKMEDDEQDRQPLPAAPALQQRGAPERWADGRAWPDLSASGYQQSWPAQSHPTWPPPGGYGQPMFSENRHRRPSHQLSKWMSYLAYDHRAENLVVKRLNRAGLAKQVERRRWLRGATVQYVPYDSVVAGTPASAISTAVRRGEKLTTGQLFLAGLFLATGPHHQTLSTLEPDERSRLESQLGRFLSSTYQQLLTAADIAVSEAAMR